MTAADAADPDLSIFSSAILARLPSIAAQPMSGGMEGWTIRQMEGVDHRLARQPPDDYQMLMFIIRCSFIIGSSCSSSFVVPNVVRSFCMSSTRPGLVWDEPTSPPVKLADVDVRWPRPVRLSCLPPFPVSQLNRRPAMARAADHQFDLPCSRFPASMVDFLVRLGVQSGLYSRSLR